MDAAPDTSNHKRRSDRRRGKRAPDFKPTRVGIEVLKLLNTYRYLPTSYIRALMAAGGHSSDYCHDLLTGLYHEAWFIDRPEASRWAENALYRDRVYELSAHGARVLKERGLYVERKRTNNNFKHEFMVSLFHASLALGVAETPGLMLISAEEILARPQCPQKTRDLRDPFRIPVTTTYRGSSEPIDMNMRHDGDPFGIGYVDGAASAALWFAGIEADRKNEPNATANYERSSIEKKFVGALKASRGGIYKEHLGLPHALLPIITINEQHKLNMMKHLKEITDGKGSGMFLFLAIPDFQSLEKFPPANGWALTATYERCGYPPINIVAKLQEDAKRGPR